MEERQAWYQRFLDGRSSPFTRPIPPGTVSDGYVYEIGKVQLRELEEGKSYYVHCYFYDGERNHFFGRDNQSSLAVCTRKTLIFEEAFFFHAPITAAVHIVLEVVRSHNGYDDLSVAWSVLEMGGQVRSLPYYGQHQQAPRLKQKLYPGSPKFLLISKTLTSFTGLEGAVETRLLAHPTLNAVQDFFPEYGLFHGHDEIPGVARDGLARGKGVPRVMGYIDGVGLTLGGGGGETGKDTVEAIVEEMMTQDWTYRANELKPGQRMEVIERRMRVGVHNGLAYISSPLTVHLVPQEELMTGTQSLRRKARTSAKGQNPPSSSHSLVVRSRISLPIVRDARFALVFSIDFLLGVRAPDNTISHSQSVMIGWGIALPFSSDPTAFYLTGGPRANPDEVLCFKSLRELGRAPSASLADGAVVRDLALAFHFYLADETPTTRIPAAEPEPEIDHREPEPEIRKPEIRRPEPEPEPAIVEIDEEIIEEEEELVPVSRREGERRQQPVRSRPERPDRERDRQPPPDAITSYREHLKVEDVYEPPVTSIQPLARSSLAFLAASKFCAIRDRNGDAPTLVDPMDGRPIDVAVERNDRLATNEVVLQLLAMKWNTQERPPARVYFTFQFFRIPMMTTEILSIDGRDSILRRMQPDAQGEYPAGFTAKLTIDRASLSSSEELATFLASGEVCIEVWDADSMIPLGTATLPLRALCRRGAEAVQFYAECAVVQSTLPVPPRTMGTLYVRAANIGHPFSNQMDLVRSHSSSFVAYSLPSIGHSSSGGEREGMVVRAKPLSASHQSSLQRFIQSQRIDMHRRYAEILNERSLKSIGDWEELKKKVPGSAHHESSLKRFIFEGELEAYRKARGESKANKLLAAVFKGLTVTHSFCISLGEVHVFEFLLANPFPHAVNCAVLMEDAALSIVHSEEEWDSWKRGIRHPKEEQRVDSTIFKRALSKDNANLLYLRPSESLLIPFKYDGLRVSAAAEEGAESEAKVIFKEINSGEPLSVLDLRVQKRPYALNRSFRFLADEMTNFEKHIRMRDKRRVQSIRCSDPSAKVGLVQDRGAAQVVRITAYMGPSMSVRKLIVFLYEDAYCHRLAATWKIEVHALTRVDVHSVQGQTTSVMLPLPSDLHPDTPLFRLHSTSPAVHLPHPQPLQLSSAARPLCVQHTSTSIGSTISLLSLTSASDTALVNIYAIHAHISAPHVSSTYQISIDSRMHEPVVKRLAVHNAYAIPRSFRLVSSHPDLMRPLNEVVSISPEGVVSPPLQFRPVDFARRTVEMHLFIQDAETGQEEETYALKVVYEPM